MNIKLLKNTGILCISSLNYEEHFTAKQQIMKKLAKYNRIFFLQKEIGLEHLIKHPSWIKFALRFLTHKIEKKDNIYIINLPVLFPGKYYFNIINNINQFIIYKYINRILKRYNVNKLIIWNFQPHTAYLCRKIKSRYIIYHCTDYFDIMAFGRKKHIISEQENETCDISDIIIAATKGIYNKFRTKYSEKTYLVYNGVDIENFIKKDLVREEPEDIKKINHPRLIHSGMVNGKVDLDLLKYLAENNPEWNFIFIGAVIYSDIDLKKFLKLKLMENIYFLGNKPVEQIPLYINKCDICLILGKQNEWTKITKPLKSYEYLAAGKPIVSIGFEELEDFRKVIFIAEDYKDFEDKIKQILEKKLINNPDKQKNLARQYSWTSRIEKIDQILQGIMKK